MRIARLLVCLELFIEFRRKLSLICSNLYLTAFRFYALLFANSTSGLNTLIPTLCLEEFGGASQSHQNSLTFTIFIYKFTVNSFITFSCVLYFCCRFLNRACNDVTRRSDLFPGSIGPVLLEGLSTNRNTTEGRRGVLSRTKVE